MNMKTTPTPTPAPWVAREDRDGMLGEDWVIGTPHGKPDEVAVCSKRDAALIAAAPDLLAALQKYVEHFGDPLRCARPAIAKATGHDG